MNSRKPDTGYCIWFMPTGCLYKRLSALISRLSRQHATPHFEPHVTLVSDIFLPKEEVIFMTTKLARALAPVEISLRKIGYANEYFRCLFIEAKKTKTLVKANKIARSVFNMELDSEYMPHLSLMYGEVSTDEKERIRADVGPRFDIRFTTKRIHLVSASSKMTCQEWRRLKHFPVVHS